MIEILLKPPSGNVDTNVLFKATGFGDADENSDDDDLGPVAKRVSLFL